MTMNPILDLYLQVALYLNRLSMAQIVKNLLAMQETPFNPSVGNIPWRREWPSTPVFLPGEFHGQKSLVWCSPGGCKELDMTE